MNKSESLKKVSELIFWCYANLAMAHYCVDNGVTEYNRTAYAIRMRMFKGLCGGTMHIHSLFDDERVKVESGRNCVYCGRADEVTIDHLFPRRFGGTDSSDNLVCCCRKCNSSKNAKDLMQWYNERSEFPSLMLLRRYFKLIYAYCAEREILDSNIDDVDDGEFPFKFANLPVKFPSPAQLHLLPVYR